MANTFGDHAANERTYLAWVRTSIAIMAFGFLVEKFTLFLNYLRLALHKSNAAIPGSTGAQFLGVFLICVAVAMLAVSTFRYFSIGRQIESGDVARGAQPMLVLALGVVLSASGALLAIYLGLQIS